MSCINKASYIDQICSLSVMKPFDDTVIMQCTYNNNSTSVHTVSQEILVISMKYQNILVRSADFQLYDHFNYIVNKTVKM